MSGPMPTKVCSEGRTEAVKRTDWKWYTPVRCQDLEVISEYEDQVVQILILFLWEKELGIF